VRQGKDDSWILSVSAFHHVAISVSNLTETMDFYAKLGFREVKTWHDESRLVFIVHLALNDYILEVFWYSDHRPAPLESAALEDDLRIVGVKHFALQVSDIQQALVTLREHGYADSSTSISLGRTGIYYFFIKDPSGNWLEFVQDPLANTLSSPKTDSS
jgi:glyoxylase I family protein